MTDHAELIERFSDPVECALDPTGASSLITTLHRENADLRAEVERLRDAQTWRPIETAPKDGSEFLVAYSDGTVRAGRCLGNSKMPLPWQGVRPMYGADRPGVKITHWMPLPVAPALGHTQGER